jgi:hypothetical protein
MLLSACAYIITHTVSSGDAKRERGVPPARETQEEREERSAVVETTRKEEENSKEEEVSLTSEPQPNRTGICPAGAAAAAGAVEREIEVEHEQEQVEERGGQEGGRLASAESAISNGAAVLRNGDVTKSSVSDSKPIMTAKVCTNESISIGLVPRAYLIIFRFYNASHGKMLKGSGSMGTRVDE